MGAESTFADGSAFRTIAGWWSLADVAAAAEVALEPSSWHHLMTGAEDERSIQLAEAAFRRWAIVPRVLTGVEQPVLGRSVLGMDAAAPIVTAPVGTNGLFHPEGERGTVSAAASAGIPAVVSMMSSVDFATIGGLCPAWAVQLYPLRDRDLFFSIAGEAIAAGARAVVLTVDTPVLGRRVRDLRSSFRSGIDSRPYIQDELERRGHSSFWDVWSGALTWQDVAELIVELEAPVVLKGILHPEDARKALSAGAAGVWVSSHGGRQLDSAVAPLEALSAIAGAVGGRAEIIADGSVRSGADIAKAIALGADAVGIGRPVIWGLAAAGTAGVERVLRLLVDQLENVLTLTGVGSVDLLSREHLLPIASAGVG